jgi:hypothetical protein
MRSWLPSHTRAVTMLGGSGKALVVPCGNPILSDCESANPQGTDDSVNRCLALVFDSVQAA